MVDSALQVSTTEAGSITRLVLSGDVTIYTAAELKDRLLRAVGPARELELDLAGVAEIDTAGIQVLLLCKRECVTAGCGMHMVAHSQPVLDLLELYDLGSHFGDPVILTGRQQGSSAA